METRLPGIARIFCLDCRDIIPQAVERSLAGLDVPVTADMRKVGYFRDATCEVKEEWANNGTVETATLTFATDRPMRRRANTGWLVEDANGLFWLIGAREPLYPSTTARMATGEAGGEPAVYRYEVKWTSRKALIPCDAAPTETPDFGE